MKKKSDISVMLKEAGILFAITLIAGVLLGFVYELTKDPIAEQREKAIWKACNAVFADADSFEELTDAVDPELLKELKENGVLIGTVYEAKSADEEMLGYVLQTTSQKGYGGNIVLYMGVTMEGKLNGISLLDIKETPGLGMQAGKVLVPQFANKTVKQFTYTKTGSHSDSEIDAISGATITTNAVTEAVNGGLQVAQQLLKGGSSNE